MPVEGFQQKRTLWAVRRHEGPHSAAAEAFMHVVKQETEMFRFDQPSSAKENVGSAELEVSRELGI